jgi:hypothetical protein
MSESSARSVLWAERAGRGCRATLQRRPRRWPFRGCHQRDQIDKSFIARMTVEEPTGPSPARCCPGPGLGLVTVAGGSSPQAGTCRALGATWRRASWSAAAHAAVRDWLDRQPPEAPYPRAAGDLIPAMPRVRATPTGGGRRHRPSRRQLGCQRSAAVSRGGIAPAGVSTGGTVTAGPARRVALVASATASARGGPRRAAGPSEGRRWLAGVPDHRAGFVAVEREAVVHGPAGCLLRQAVPPLRSALLAESKQQIVRNAVAFVLSR